jgi:hypothetical protein
MRGRLPNPSRRPKNWAEGLFYDEAVKVGLRPSKRGWPDFVLFDEDGELAMCVEVKPHRGRRLKREQHAVMKALAKAGVPCYRWAPDSGLQKVDPDNFDVLS